MVWQISVKFDFCDVDIGGKVVFVLSQGRNMGCLEGLRIGGNLGLNWVKKEGIFMRNK